MAWLIVAGWVVCGVLAYGIEKATWRNFCNNHPVCGYEWEDEFICWFFAFIGILGLLAALMISVRERTFGFCYRMPKEFCEPRQLEEKEFGGAAKNLRELREKGLPLDIKKEIDDRRHPR